MTRYPCPRFYCQKCARTYRQMVKPPRCDPRVRAIACRFGRERHAHPVARGGKCLALRLDACALLLDAGLDMPEPKGRAEGSAGNRGDAGEA